jgi:T4 RnlA family RNA ligase
MNYIITYEDALRICDAYRNFNFYKTEHMFDKYKVVTFNYFMCDPKWFSMPLREAPEINAYDMRGVTFVFNEDGTLYKRFLMLPKFFNVNQVEETQMNLIKDKKIKHVTIKEDGSLIAFMQLPNGEIFAKTQAGFTNEQSIQALKLYKSNEKIRSYVNDVLKAGFTPLFEYVAFDNRIVLKYTERELRLIGLRNNGNGNYTSAADMDADIAYGIRTILTTKIDSISELENLMETAEDMEGVVVEFEDGQLVKWKTQWYFNLHGIRTMHVFREDYIIKNYLMDTLDDVTQELNMTDDADAFTFIEKVKNTTNNWSSYIEDNVNELVDAYNSEFYFGHWTKFATDKHKNPFFRLAKVKIEKPKEYRKFKKDYMLNAARHLQRAKQIIEKYENTHSK